MFPDTCIFVQMLTIDSVFNAIHFLKEFVDNNLDENMVVRRSKLLYKYSVLDRYIYYLTCFLSYTTLCNFFWISYNVLSYVSLFIFTFPLFLNKMMNCVIFHRIIKGKEDIIKFIITKQMAFLIKTMSKNYLQKDVDINHVELLPLFDNYDKTMDYMLDIIKNSLIIFLTSYIKQYSSKLSYKLMKYAYNYKTGDILKSFNEKTARNDLLDIIENKKWKLLLDPNVFRASLYLYQINNKDPDVLKKLINIFNYKLGKFFTIWTISSFFNNMLIVPIASLFMLCYRKKINISNNIENIQRIIITSLSTLIGIHFNNYMLASFLCQFGYNILCNKIVHTIYKQLMNKFLKKSYELNYRNSKYIVPIIIISLVTIIFGYNINRYNILIVLVNIVGDIAMGLYYEKSIAQIFLLLFCYSSGYNVVHIIHNSIIYYIIIGNIYKIKNIVVVEQKKTCCIGKHEVYDDYVLLEEDKKDEFIKNIKINDTVSIINNYSQ